MIQQFKTKQSKNFLNSQPAGPADFFFFSDFQMNFRYRIPQLQKNPRFSGSLQHFMSERKSTIGLSRFECTRKCGPESGLGSVKKGVFLL